MPDDFTLTPVDHDPFDLSEPADLSHTLGEGLVQLCCSKPLGPHPEISHQRARKRAADWSGYGSKPAARRTPSGSLLMTVQRG
jgi:hypothetical protein